MVNLYEALSFALSPTAVAFYVIVIFSMFSPIGLGSASMISSIAIGTIFMVLIPSYSVYYFTKKFINTERRDREIPYLISIASYLVSSVIFLYLNSHVMFLISMAYVFVASTSFVINLFWKISVHAAGVAGPTTALVYVFGIWMAPIYLITLLILWTRFRLKAHSASQLLAGAFMAVFITSLTYIIMW